MLVASSLIHDWLRDSKRENIKFLNHSADPIRYKILEKVGFCCWHSFCFYRGDQFYCTILTVAFKYTKKIEKKRICLGDIWCTCSCVEQKIRWSRFYRILNDALLFSMVDLPRNRTVKPRISQHFTMLLACKIPRALGRPKLIDRNRTFPPRFFKSV